MEVVPSYKLYKSVLVERVRPESQLVLVVRGDGLVLHLHFYHVLLQTFVRTLHLLQLLLQVPISSVLCHLQQNFMLI